MGPWGEAAVNAIGSFVDPDVAMHPSTRTAYVTRRIRYRRTSTIAEASN